MKSYYSIIIPIYNEASSISELLKFLKPYHKKGHEIIIVDDGSNDGSSKVISKNKYINIIRLDHNKGKGIALKKGLEIARNNKIIIFDGDLEIHPNQIQNLMFLSSGENIRCILANRFKDKQTSSFWDLGNIILTGMFNYLYDSDVKDALCCAKAFFKSDINIRFLKSEKFDIDVELLSMLIKMKSEVRNIDIKYQRRTSNQGKKLKLRDSFKILLRILSKN